MYSFSCFFIEVFPNILYFCMILYVGLHVPESEKTIPKTGLTQKILDKITEIQ